jgi:hypothetical protein
MLSKFSLSVKSTGNRRKIAAGLVSLLAGCSSAADSSPEPSSVTSPAGDSGSMGSSEPTGPMSGVGAAAGAGGGGSGGSAGSDSPNEIREGGASTADAADGGDAASPDAIVGDATGTTAVQMSDFLDSIGVVTHIGIGLDAVSSTTTAVSYLGVRTVRENVNASRTPDWISMHQSLGIRVCLVTDNDLANTIAVAKQLRAAGALLAVEGPNEANNWPITYQGQTSSKTTSLPLAQFQKDLYAAVKGDPELDTIPVFHTSEGGGAEPDNVGLQFLTIPDGAGTLLPAGTKFADYANLHSYLDRSAGHQLVGNDAWNAFDSTLNAQWAGMYAEYGHTWKAHFDGYSNTQLPTVPRVITETGWATGAPLSINEEQEGRLYLTEYLSAFKRGFAHAFLYMLKDEPESGSWAMLGLFDQNYQPKKPATYLHDFMAIVADQGTRTPGKLDYSIAAQQETVHDLLLQKSTGAFELVVWDERPMGGSDAVVVDLHTARPSVKVFDPTVGTAPTQTLQNASSVKLTLSDHPWSSSCSPRYIGPGSKSDSAAPVGSVITAILPMLGMSMSGIKIFAPRRAALSRDASSFCTTTWESQLE